MNFAGFQGGFVDPGEMRGAEIHHSHVDELRLCSTGVIRPERGGVRNLKALLGFVFHSTCIAGKQGSPAHEIPAGCFIFHNDVIIGDISGAEFIEAVLRAVNGDIEMTALPGGNKQVVLVLG